ncbi:2-amino-4-hydroxy-6-hydroxymethyldihydropteridine diphosphokinase [Hyphococcus luteus]|uniref:2-amino-4-hydroxy-6-hydroxymethyldihydropteridine pyrophosphokinase n=1 Tax=Hyphococcus luteus TaxID=2058213 RepID=A0A2S7K1R5_9PROT|nr:2-amino-4-hydroxy-6-hydroxymethyldihydropteridine diphosphokinase [Marinicaulis flavus]PQA86449.1 2-amino-4-hydroxy-6-hydroxymethyldihydropteridine diphosphokinase [Marinicaulis flavus]
MILIAAGSNLPFCGLDSQDIVLRAFNAIGRMSHLKRVSSLYNTPAWPDPADPPFVNAVAEIETDMGPQALLAALHAVEAGFGRRRSEKNAPRTLDLDLLAYHDMAREGADGGPALPHPRLADRAFVLIPLAEIAPDWRHPVTGERAGALAARLTDRGAAADVVKIS